MSAELASLQKRFRLARAARSFLAGAAVTEGFLCGWHVATGMPLLGMGSGLLGVVLTMCAVVLTAVVRRLRREEARLLHELRPRPDYLAIARMELEVWGRTFEHAGAPDDAPVRLRYVPWDEDGERYCSEHGRKHEDGGW